MPKRQAAKCRLVPTEIPQSATSHMSDGRVLAISVLTASQQQGRANHDDSHLHRSPSRPTVASGVPAESNGYLGTEEITAAETLVR